MTIANAGKRDIAAANRANPIILSFQSLLAGNLVISRRQIRWTGHRIPMTSVDDLTGLLSTQSVRAAARKGRDLVPEKTSIFLTS
jgi:hypothetical protein